VHAAQSIGASTCRILWRHILPNIMPPIIVLFTTRVGTVILAESGLSFLGLGVPPPTPTWGGMLSGSGRTFMFQGPWLALAPGPVPDRRRLRHQRVRRRAARSARSAHARLE
jgi:peptide/nickel transport system permease protein